VLNFTPNNCVEDLHFWNESQQYWFVLASRFPGFGWHSTTYRGDTAAYPWRGYYARAPQIGCRLSIRGNATYENTNVPLKSGWNLVGWFTPWRAIIGNDSAVENPFELNEAAYIEVWRRIGLGWEKIFRNVSDSGWTIVDSGSGATFNETAPFEAYWIFVDRNVTWLAKVQ
jgi:hypothetical protein